MKLNQLSDDSENEKDESEKVDEPFNSRKFTLKETKQ